MIIESAPAESIGVQTRTDVSRRGIFRVGTAVIATVAALSTPKPASADGGLCGSYCCDLYTCHMCTAGVCGGWVCPSGYIDSWWMCTSGSHYCTCGECTQTSNCHFGPFGGCSVAYCN